MKLKHLVLSALAAVGINLTAQADVADIKSRIVPSGVETTNVSDDGTAFKYSLVDGGVEDVVVVFTGTDQQYEYTIPADVSQIRYLAVAGGGSGGGGYQASGGGGGAGGMLEKSFLPVQVGDVLKINVGKGGEQALGDAAGNIGTDSAITNDETEIVRVFGGGGGGSKSYPATTGGSGGGSSGYGASQRASVASRDSAQGNAGGGTAGSNNIACGGGGAGGNGESGTDSGSNLGGAGGSGRISDITDIPVYYAGGGGGGSRSAGFRGGFGGIGGGGSGGYGSGANAYGQSGVDGLGGGGGGVEYSTVSASEDWPSGKGGDGIVIIRYTIGDLPSFRYMRARDGYSLSVDDDIVMVYTNVWHSHQFTVPDGVSEFRYLVVGGGGAGGGSDNGSQKVGGGGGAGGMLTGENIGVGKDDVLTIKVGAGGLPKSGDAGGIGGDSSLFKGDGQLALAYGGGGGGATETKVATEGASGGGGSGGYQKPNCAGASAKNVEPKQGYKGGGGGSSSNKTVFGSGGGGAGGEGGTGAQSAPASGVGGVGLPCDITGEENKYYAGGGGGASHATGDTTGSVGGLGGGGAGGGQAGVDGEDGTGSGGGGAGRYNSYSGAGGRGGNGVVIIRFAAPKAAKSTIHFSHESNTATWVATSYGADVVENSEVDFGAPITVVATPNDGYEYASAPKEWTKNEDDSITKDFTADANPYEIVIPAAAEIPFTMNFTGGANASFKAMVGDQEVTNGDKIRTGYVIDIVATPNTDCEYVLPIDGWEAGDVEGTIKRSITAGEGVPQVVIPDATAILYVNLKFTSDGKSFYEATNSIGEVVKDGDRVRAGDVISVKVWAGIGYEFKETPSGWEAEAEGGPYTKTFTAVYGSELEIEIPHATKVTRPWTKTLPDDVGYILEDGKDLVYVFTNTTVEGYTMFLPGSVTSIRYLAVGGGGAGGGGSGGSGGGGGAGGMLETNITVEAGAALKINVGKGGQSVSGTGSSTSFRTGNNGEDSVIMMETTDLARAFGGGGGGGGQLGPKSGGSGGGSNGGPAIQVGGATPIDSAQGKAGGGEAGKQLVAAGGGGAGDVGKNASGNTDCSGGAGGVGRVSNITGEEVYYAGGGGGGGRGTGGRSSGGEGGGGQGGGSGDKNGLPGVDGLGGGGGGMFAATETYLHSGKGGDGVVILRFKKPNGVVLLIY